MHGVFAAGWAVGNGQLAAGRAKALAAVAGSVAAWHPCGAGPCKAQVRLSCSCSGPLVAASAETRGPVQLRLGLPQPLMQLMLQPEPLYAQVNMEKKRNRQPSLGNSSLNHLAEGQTQPQGQPPPLTSLPTGKDSWV